MDHYCPHALSRDLKTTVSTAQHTSEEPHSERQVYLGCFLIILTLDQGNSNLQDRSLVTVGSLRHLAMAAQIEAEEDGPRQTQTNETLIEMRLP